VEKPASSRLRPRSRAARVGSSRGSGWNEIGVDGLPIRGTEEFALHDSNGDAAPPSTLDLVGWMGALAVSVLLTQLSLWWLVGVDPLGLAPVVSPWLPIAVPGGLA
jgi:hypothetical protein